MNRRIIGWLLVLGSPGFATTTLVVLAGLVERIYGRTPLYCALIIVVLTGMIAIWGTAGGACLLVRNQPWRFVAGMAAGLGGTFTFMISIAVAEDHLSWL